jgi:hypothetical protein
LELLPNVIPKVPELGSRIQDPTGMLLTRAQRTRRAGQLLASGVAVSLINHGWKLRAQPGVLFIWRGDDQINPFLMVDELISGELSAETWVSQCCQLGISHFPLFETRETSGARREQVILSPGHLPNPKITAALLLFEICKSGAVRSSLLVCLGQ